MSIFTSKNVWKFLIKIQLTKSNPKIIGGVNPPCLMPIRVNDGHSKRRFTGRRMIKKINELCNIIKSRTNCIVTVWSQDFIFQFSIPNFCCKSALRHIPKYFIWLFSDNLTTFKMTWFPKTPFSTSFVFLIVSSKGGSISESFSL